MPAPSVAQARKAPLDLRWPPPPPVTQSLPSRSSFWKSVAEEGWRHGRGLAGVEGVVGWRLCSELLARYVRCAGGVILYFAIVRFFV